MWKVLDSSTYHLLRPPSSISSDLESPEHEYECFHRVKASDLRHVIVQYSFSLTQSTKSTNQINVQRTTELESSVESETYSQKKKSSL